MISPYPKIFTIGTNYIADIFKDDVVVEEKLDGSQFSFGRINGEVQIRSKGAQLYVANPEKMFAEGIAYVDSISAMLPEGMIFYCEYLKKPKHNSLAYAGIPKNHLMLFGVMDVSQKFRCEPGDIEVWAKALDIDPVPCFFRGKVENAEHLMGFLDNYSYLGGPKIEGVVVKNYTRQFLLGGQPIPLMAGKFVSEAFKEVHRERWGAEEKGKSRMEVFFSTFRTEARWEKAIQHLREKGMLEDNPRDIGALLKEIHADIEAEEKDNIKEFLYREFVGEVKRKASAGFAEWYKERTMKLAFPS